jgi:peptidoglycan/LPS O-acetylase OafA/YrhL
VSSGAALLLLHVSREGFFFVSTCMLTYAYSDLNRSGLRRYYWRRFLSVGVPYLCWTGIYFFFLMPTTHYHSIASALSNLESMACTGYYQLYFLIRIMEFYLVFPLVLLLLRKTSGHHGLLFAVAALAQVAMCVLTHWRLLPPFMMKYAGQDVLEYVLYLAGGCVVACHLEQADAWVRGHTRLILTLTAVAGLAAEGIYFLAQHGVTTVLGSGNDAFQPSVSHLLVLTTLAWLGWRHLNAVIPWPLLCLLTVGIVSAACTTLTALLARTPLAVPLTGRRRVRWRRTASSHREPARQLALAD